MTREVPARRAARWLVLLLFPLFALGVQPAEAAKARTTQHAVKKKVSSAKKPVAKKKVAKKSSARKTVVAKKGTKKKVVAKARPAKAFVAEAPFTGPLKVSASAAYVIDQQTGEVLFGKNPESVQPIASLTKLMTGFIIAEAKLPMNEKITISDEDVDRMKFSSSRLKVGTELTRAQALHLALMSSENRAAHALARTYPGGESAFVSAMNVKAAQLGMKQTRYVEPTGLSSANRSSAHDLALLTAAAYDQPLLRRYSTSPGYRLGTDHGTLQYVNSNRLVRSGSWDIGVQKTGYIREAGYTLLMQAELAGRKLIMVFLDSASKVTRMKDPEKIRQWLKSHPEVTAGDKANAPG
ncbi:peptidase S11 [Ramlibacter sp. USB13]|uniref:Peptidase S11 n=1 Tax=Ramlibacter cellulosilyticus TaxID=2764187 RepID=A0A923S9V5_9BURK|nr:serine hydrolase [Ramlibacter cellulosilyticus]MBC5781618.1 peptidase S11 [Ramlibacter cellulosilyticus]